MHPEGRRDCLKKNSCVCLLPTTRNPLPGSSVHVKWNYLGLQKISLNWFKREAAAGADWKVLDGTVQPSPCAALGAVGQLWIDPVHVPNPSSTTASCRPISLLLKQAGILLPSCTPRFGDWQGGEKTGREVPRCTGGSCITDSPSWDRTVEEGTSAWRTRVKLCIAGARRRWVQGIVGSSRAEQDMWAESGRWILMLWV